MNPLPAKKTEKRRARKISVPATVRARKHAPTVERADGLRPGTKLAKLLDAAVGAGEAGTTEKDLCKKLGGWKSCASTLGRVCARVGATIERKDDRFVVRMPLA